MSDTYYGPTLAISEETHARKYRPNGESFLDMASRIAGAITDGEEHRKQFRRQLLQMVFMPAGRIQLAIGNPSKATPYNCFVSGVIEDSSDSIMDKAKEAFMTMRMGGGIGYNFSHIRPKGDWIKSSNTPASGPVSFMHIFDAVCSTVKAAGNRRGAQMGVLRVDHPDIEEFINAKRNDDTLTNFNVSIGVTDVFMQAVVDDADFDLVFEGQVRSSVDARALWDTILRATWDWAEPGVLFIDRINEWNNLWYCEDIEATNPCAEQPLPPYGACLLGSFNMTRYVRKRGGRYFIDFEAFATDIPAVVRAMDNVVDVAIYPLPEQEAEAKSKRRMGLGQTGEANAYEACGHPYGTEGYIKLREKAAKMLRNIAYESSALLAAEKGAFPLYDKEKYLQGKFIKTLPKRIRDLVAEHGIRNSHLLSIAPTGTISLSADNISSGIEPVFASSYDRTIVQDDGTPKTERVEDYGYREFHVEPRTADDLSVEEHVNVLVSAQKYVDSSVSKTCNVGDDVTWERFKDVYMTAWRDGAKGCTTFRASGLRYGVLNKTEPEEAKGEACFIDPSTGSKTCE